MTSESVGVCRVHAFLLQEAFPTWIGKTLHSPTRNTEILESNNA